MKLCIYQVDTFTNKLFEGNPAAVIITNEWLPTELMQNISAENNLAETAFVRYKNNKYQIRWFTPKVEVELCGHATLASAHVIFNYIDPTINLIAFESKFRGILKVFKEKDNSLTLDFPRDKIEKVVNVKKVYDCFNTIEVLEVFKGRIDYLAIVENQQTVENLDFNLDAISRLPDARGLIVSGMGSKKVDFVSRYFAPQSGINEDPVTGSAHTTLMEYWTKRLKKSRLNARQLSSRKGNLFCSLEEERVKINGKAVTYMKGEIEFNIS